MEQRDSSSGSGLLKQKNQNEKQKGTISVVNMERAEKQNEEHKGESRSFSKSMKASKNQGHYISKSRSIRVSGNTSFKENSFLKGNAGVSLGKIGKRYSKIFHEFVDGRSMRVMNMDSTIHILRNSFLNETLDKKSNEEILRKRSRINGIELGSFEEFLQENKIKESKEEEQFIQRVLGQSGNCHMIKPFEKGAKGAPRMFFAEDIDWSRIIQGKPKSCSVSGALILMARYDQLFKTHFVRNLFLLKKVRKTLIFSDFLDCSWFRGFVEWSSKGSCVYFGCTSTFRTNSLISRTSGFGYS